MGEVTTVVHQADHNVQKRQDLVLRHQEQYQPGVLHLHLLHQEVTRQAVAHNEWKEAHQVCKARRVELLSRQALLPHRALVHPHLLLHEAEEVVDRVDNDLL